MGIFASKIDTKNKGTIIFYSFVHLMTPPPKDSHILDRILKILKLSHNTAESLKCREWSEESKKH